MLDPSFGLIVAALLGIAVIVCLIVFAKVHAFLALMLGSFVMAILAGVPLTDSFTSFTTGLGSTVGNVGVLITLGSMIGVLLTKTGASDQIVDTIVAHSTKKTLPWAIAAVAFIMGISLFFEVGLVLMIPVVMSLAKRQNMPAIALGVPAIAALGCLHGFVPPHPGPLTAISYLNANLGITLALGLIVAIPTTIISGPLVAKWMAKAVPVKANELYASGDAAIAVEDRPSFLASLMIVLLPVILMLLNAVFELTGWDIPYVTTLVSFFGSSVVALLSAVIYGAFALGLKGGRSFKEVNGLLGGSFASIAGILMIVGAGGGFKQTLVDSGIAEVLGGYLVELAVPLFVSAWLIAVFIRLATGSATVATITAAGIVAPLAASCSTIELSLIVLAIGAGSMFLSHVNDGGFWMVKEYFGLTMGQTFKTWSLSCTLISVIGLVGVCLISLFV